MKVYTSYFGNAKALSKAGIKIIGVALGRPKFLPNVPQLRCVCPTSFMLTEACTMEEFLKRYDEILSRLDAHVVMSQIEALSGGCDVALCCYEKPGYFCHRHILAKWLKGNTGKEIKEYSEKKTPTRNFSVINICKSNKVTIFATNSKNRFAEIAQR